MKTLIASLAVTLYAQPLTEERLLETARAVMKSAKIGRAHV